MRCSAEGPCGSWHTPPPSSSSLRAAAPRTIAFLRAGVRALRPDREPWANGAAETEPRAHPPVTLCAPGRSGLARYRTLPSRPPGTAQPKARSRAGDGIGGGMRVRARTREPELKRRSVTRSRRRTGALTLRRRIALSGIHTHVEAKCGTSANCRRARVGALAVCERARTAQSLLVIAAVLPQPGACRRNHKGSA